MPKEEVYPFSKAKTIRVISYSNRMTWDPDSEIIKDGILVLDVAKIKEHVTLDEKLQQRLYEFLFVDECPVMSSSSKCYDPRHLVLFHDEKGKVLNYFEVCLECGSAEANFEYNEVCNERMGKLKSIFKDAGIKYFGE